MSSFVVKRLESSKSSFKFLDGSERRVVILPSLCVGSGLYQPGWKWSVHVGKPANKISQAHIGYIQSGFMAVKSADGKELLLGPGDLFEVDPNHDAWVVGDLPCFALDFEIKKPPKKLLVVSLYFVIIVVCQLRQTAQK